ncbi:uncharacterized protein LOC133564439 [Nerophis ophidion]|uniref:uncharacterized protein LOC133564439 n=1 Tax=Nerophis ophidion TaxID=159077 RepID=UPI002ADF6AA9|nr:uncharacterized protein LOC133564439 [Nerophis ophidion]
MAERFVLQSIQSKQFEDCSYHFKRTQSAIVQLHQELSKEKRMEGTKVFCLFLMPLLCDTQANLSLPAFESNQTTNDPKNSFDMVINGTRSDCLVDAETGLIAVGTAGGLIVCLLVATVVLACQVYHIRRQVYAPRTSNMYLVSGTDYWDNNPPDIGGLVGPCETSLMMEEVRAEEENRAKKLKQCEGARAEIDHRAFAMALDPEDKKSHLLSSNSKNYCLENPKDLEDKPLVV